MSSSIYDPLSRVDLPPSRHAVESDSESDSEDGFDTNEQQGAGSRPASPLALKSNEEISTFQGKRTVILLDQVGEAITRQLSCSEQASASWRDRQQGSLAQGLDGWLYVLLYPASTLESRTEELALFIRRFVATLSPTSLHLISQYNPSLYISSVPSGDSTSAPLRYMCTSVAGDVSVLPASPFSAPNYLSKAEATLIQEAVYRSIPSIAVLVPSKVPKPRPHARLVFVPDRKKSKKASSGAALSLEEEFPSDEEEDVPAFQFEEADPLPLNLDSDTGLDADELFAQLNATLARHTGLVGKAASVPREQQILSPGAASDLRHTAAMGLSAFVERRRREAIKRRRDLGGMYV